MKHRYLVLLAVLTFVGLHVQAGILNSAGDFAVLGGSTVTNTGFSTVTGDLGLNPGTSVTGFPPGTISGTQHITDATAALAQVDLARAYNGLVGMPVTTNLTGQDLGGLTLVSGVYRFDTTAQLTGTLILDAQGKDVAYWVFQIGSTLTTAANSLVDLVNDSVPGHTGIFWVVGTSATLDTNTAFGGNLLALTSITMNSTTSILSGRALAQNGAITLDTNTININGPDYGDGLKYDIDGTTIVPIVIPEPGTLILLVAGLLLLLASTNVRRTKRIKSGK